MPLPLRTHTHTYLAPDARKVYRVKIAQLLKNWRLKRKNKTPILFQLLICSDTNYETRRHVDHTQPLPTKTSFSLLKKKKKEEKVHVDYMYKSRDTDL